MFDSHAHYDENDFNIDREELIKKVHEAGVEYILNAGTNIKSSKMSIELSNQFSFVYAAVGIHPHDVRNTIPGYLDIIKDMITKKVVAIGEIGLDYHYDFSPREAQIRCFIEQINLAKDLKLPIIVHNRESHEDMLKILMQEKVGQIGGILHCFSGSLEMAKEIIKLGMFIGVGGPITFNNARKIIEVVQNIPLEFIVSETDCPYLAPVPFRGSRNDSSYMKYIIEKIAEIKGLSFEETDKILTDNAKRILKIN